MNTLRALIAIPFALAGLAIQTLFLPVLLTFIAWAIWGYHSAPFGWTALFCAGWVYLEYRHLRRQGSGGRRGLR